MCIDRVQSDDDVLVYADIMLEVSAARCFISSVHVVWEVCIDASQRGWGHSMLHLVSTM